MVDGLSDLLIQLSVSLINFFKGHEALSPALRLIVSQAFHWECHFFVTNCTFLPDHEKNPVFLALICPAVGRINGRALLQSRPGQP